MGAVYTHQSLGCRVEVALPAEKLPYRKCEVEPFVQRRQEFYRARIFLDGSYRLCSGMKVSNRVMVYAFDGKGGQFYVVSCDHTSSLEFAGANLRFGNCDRERVRWL